MPKKLAEHEFSVCLQNDQDSKLEISTMTKFSTRTVVSTKLLIFAELSLLEDFTFFLKNVFYQREMSLKKLSYENLFNKVNMNRLTKFLYI